MKKFEQIYDLAEGNFGLVTFSEAKRHGVSIRELDRWVKDGRLEKLSRGVYRIVRFSPSEYDSYAAAVESVGTDAYLCGESVIALLRLVPTNPSLMYVASPRRVRKHLGNGMVLVKGLPDYVYENYNGIRSQRLGDAIRSCRATVRPDRRIRAAKEGFRQGYLAKGEVSKLIREITNETSA